MASPLLTFFYLSLLGLGLLFAGWEFFLLFQHLKRSRSAAPSTPPSESTGPLPHVTVQIPLFNERFSAARVIEAVGALDYPDDRLEIQVLDDSTDETREIVDLAVASLRERGRRAEVVRRSNRLGYKAGALAHGLSLAKGELIAIFDADFVPQPDFLKRLIVSHNAFADPRVGFAQARWQHRNLEANVMTRAQAIMLDRFFLLVNPVRQSMGFVIQFNGSGGIWRKSCIEEAGGWTADTLTEDFDLSYRAALRGWKGVYLPSVGVPCDLPADLAAFKRQQRRWARGTTQCFVKLIPDLLHAPWTVGHRWAEIATVAGYHTQALVLLMAALWPFFVFLIEPRLLFTATQILFAPLAWAAPVAFFLAHRAREVTPTSRQVRDVVTAIAVSQGLSIAVTAAIARAYLTKDAGEFERTPKRVPQGVRLDSYLVPRDWTVWAEGLATLYCLGAFVLIATADGLLWAWPMLLWAASFGFVFLLQVKGPVKGEVEQPEPSLSPSISA